MNKVVIFDFTEGEFRCIENNQSLWTDCGDYCLFLDDYASFKIVANKQHGAQIIQELVHGAVEMIHGELYKDPEKRAMAYALRQSDNYAGIDAFIDKYTELLTESLNAAFAELESK